MRKLAPLSGGGCASSSSSSSSSPSFLSTDFTRGRNPSCSTGSSGAFPPLQLLLIFGRSSSSESWASVSSSAASWRGLRTWSSLWFTLFISYRLKKKSNFTFVNTSNLAFHKIGNVGRSGILSFSLSFTLSCI